MASKLTPKVPVRLIAKAFGASEKQVKVVAGAIAQALKEA